MAIKFKYIIIIFVFSILFVSCKQNQKFDIENNTININIEGNIEQSVKFNNRYYCFFETNFKYQGLPILAKRFYIILEDGTIEHKINIPNEINNAYYYDLHIRNDSIIVKVYMSNICYYFDTERLEWAEIYKVDDLVFEDDKFYVTYLDFGEWGNTVWFKDKTTGIEYELEATRPIINKIDNVYFITNYNKILAVKNPLDLKVCEPNNYYKIVSDKNIYAGNNSTDGADTIFAYNTKNETDSIFYIATSFVSENKLFHLCVDNNGTYIGVVNNEKMEIVQRFEEKIFAYNFYYSYRNKIHNTNQLLNFYTDNDNLFGFIEITKNMVFVHYIQNEYPLIPQYIGSDKADNYFYNVLDLFNSKNENFSLNNIDSIEQEIGSIDINLPYFIDIGTYLYPNRNEYKLETPKVYFTIEDFIITNQRTYYYAKDDGLIKATMFDWIVTSREYSMPYNILYKIAIFKNKFNKIKECIINKLGNPNYSQDELDTVNKSFVWETSNGMVIKLYFNDSRSNVKITMIMYKNE
jgi:hypothetical protein